MLIYNKITELTYDQFLILFVIEVSLLLITLILFKKKLSFKLILYSSIIALALSLLSLIVVNGFYGGMAYHERFGYPFQFQWISRSIDDISTPWGIRFDIWKYIANTIYWGIYPFLILFEVLSKKKSKKFQLFIITSITFFILITMGFSYINDTSRSQEKVNSTIETSIDENDFELSDIESRKKIAIEDEYTEFKGFVENSSFAGTSIKTVEQANDHYFAYILHGSGIPIIQATCFRVDRMFRVYKVGDFPDPLDSYIGYTDINPIDYLGIK